MSIDMDAQSPPVTNEQASEARMQTDLLPSDFSVRGDKTTPDVVRVARGMLGAVEVGIKIRNIIDPSNAEHLSALRLIEAMHIQRRRAEQSTPTTGSL